jgi:hypothetical protein
VFERGKRGDRKREGGAEREVGREREMSFLMKKFYSVLSFTVSFFFRSL